MPSNSSSNASATPFAGSPAGSSTGPAPAYALPAASSVPPRVASAAPGARRERPGASGWKRIAEENALILAGKIPTDENGQPQTKKRRGLLADLILNGEPTNNVFGRPRKSKAPGTVNAIGPSQRAKAPRFQPREFLLPSIEHDDHPGSGNDEEALFVTPGPRGAESHEPSPDGSPDRREPTDHPNPQYRRVRLPTPRAATPPGFQPERQVATKRTASHQLYFPTSLTLQSKANMHAWNDKPTHSDRTVFVLVHQIDDDIIDMGVYKSLNDANHDVIKTMTKNHPEAFAKPRENPENDGGPMVKVEDEPERADSILRKLDPATAVAGSPVPDRDSRGALRLPSGPEPKFVYWGEWKFTSNCLKMEARMADGIRVKIFVSLKQLREPRRD
ncbi:hypothetical protein SLS62_010282 [Diatrype stigma]|uniref:Uncharacterized protein n=1 Tax=Diatrype stigma TaxID=117547 RepID=A0AAN9U9V5_9PEZI